MAKPPSISGKISFRRAKAGALRHNNHAYSAEGWGEATPHALARLLEIDRQGSYRFTSAERKVLVRDYMLSILKSGVGCSANICGNRALQRYIATQARRNGEANAASSSN